MGDQNVSTVVDNELRARFIRCLLNDVKAFEHILENNLFEDDIVRIGAEQEFCLVNDSWRPANNAADVLKAVDDPHFTTEIARYNLEINLDPIELDGTCFTSVEQQLSSLLDKARTAAADHGSKVVLTGILPSISKNELTLNFMTDNPRYHMLNENMKAVRGRDFDLNLSGVDELTITHDSVLFEGCNTSFQMHLQIPSHDFISSYNWAQAIAGPVLSVCTNSPLLLGRELWSETRIALFQQSIDTRSSSYALKDQMARVTFGSSWAKGTAADIYKYDVARYNVLMPSEIEEDSLDILEKGGIPKLRALNMHNGTIYRWNRACYGVGGGKPHLRIENRYIPAGPSVIDEIANFAFWVGLMIGRPKVGDDIGSQMDFRDAKANFFRAALTGKDTSLHWMGAQRTAANLITKELLPMAYAGLQNANITKEDCERLLGIIEMRLGGNTGTKWLVRNYRNLRKSVRQDDALLTLTKGLHENQKTGEPVHTWPMVNEELEVHASPHLVAHIMSTKVFVVKENDLAELATRVMEWHDIHHVPVENRAGDLCGLLTWTHIEHYKKEHADQTMLVSEIMTDDVITVKPDTTIKRAIELMKKLEYGCMPVALDKHLLGIITIKDVEAFDED